MRTRSNVWMAITQSGEFTVDSIAVINGVQYSAITAPVIKRGLFSGSTISVGNCISATLTFTVKTTDVIPRAAEVRIRYRVKNEEQTSEWAECGPFWINRRKINDDLISLECYDAMLKANQPYVDDSTSLNWSKAMSVVVNRCAQLMGVQIDSRTVIKTGAAYMVTKPDATTPLLDILGDIAAVHGGNWVITDDGKLRMVKLVTAPELPRNWTDHQTNIIQNDSWNNLEFMPSGSENPDNVDSVSVPVVIDELTTGNPIIITRVTMELDSETGWTKGNSDGFEVLIKDNPYVSEEACNALWYELYGLRYMPYTVRNACYDPAAELGDYFIVGANNADSVFGSLLCDETRKFDTAFSADVTAPAEEETDNEFAFYSEMQRMSDETERLFRYTQNVGRELDSKIEQTRESIELSVSETYTPNTRAVVGERSYYYLSNSPTVLDGGEWSQNPPTRTDGTYVWTKTEYIRADGSSFESNPFCPTGNDGKNGTNGTSQYLHVKYSDDGGETFTENEGETVGNYIGTLVDDQEEDRLDVTLYTWVKFQAIDGKDGTPGAPGKDGTSVTILGSFDTVEELEAAHPTGDVGDSYIVAGDLYVWTPTGEQTGVWTNVGQIQGPAALYLYITSNASTSTPKEVVTNVTLTGCVGQGNLADVDPQGTAYRYAWFISSDLGNDTEYFYAAGKNLNISIDSGLCIDRASMRFTIGDDTMFYLTDDLGRTIATDTDEPLEVA